MRMNSKMALTSAAVAAMLAGGVETAAQTKKHTAQYWMSADTSTGLQAMGRRAVKTLRLQLGSDGSAPAPAGEHLPPSALGAGASLPLVTPVNRPATATPSTLTADGMPQMKGKLLIYWGCGERAKAGQPVVVDYSTLGKGKAAPAIFSQTLVTPQQPPAAGKNATYGEWPNERARVTVPGSGSLVGQHVVRANYAPEMKFALSAGQDFLGALNLTSNAKAPTGASRLAWSPVAGATAYGAMVMGSQGDGTMVMWSSSETQVMPFALNDYLSDADVQKLLARQVLMAPSKTECVVPQEVGQATQSAMLMMSAYGREANFAQPKPTGAPASWRPDWTTKVRFKSSTSGMLGMTMPAMAGGMPDEAGEDTANMTPVERARAAMRARQGGQRAPARGQPAAPSAAGAVLRGLGGMIGR